MPQLLYVILIQFSCLSLALGQSTPIAQAYNEADYEACIELCDQALAEDQQNAQTWFFKGSSLIRLQKFQEGKAALEQAEKLEFANTNALQAGLLTAEAGMHATEAALKRLRSMADQGFASTQLFNRKEFDSLKGNPAYEKLLQKINVNANPCKHRSEHKRLDFWLGEWDVYVGGNKSAISFITKSHDGCTLHEDYRTNSGFFGTSYNYYDPQDSLYKQIWIDKFNSITNYHEIEHDEGKLVMIAKRPNGNLSRMSYQLDTAEQSVTQTMEGSNDEGKTWNANFVGVYKKKNTISE